MLAGGGLGDERGNGCFVGGAGCHPGQGDLFTGYGCGGGFPAQQGAVAPGGTAGVCVDFVFELGFAGCRQVAVGLAAGFDGVGQGACQVGQRVDGGLPGAQDVAYGALAGVLAVDVGFEAGLVVAELALQCGGVEVSHPAFCRVGVCALLGCAEQGLGVEWDGRLQVHAGFEGVLLVAGVQGHPGVGLALPWGVAGASAGVVLDEGFDPGVLDAQGLGLPAAHQGGGLHPALAPNLLGGVYGLCAADPVQGLGGGDVYLACGVPRGDVAGAQQGYEQAGGVNGVAGFLVQRVLRALHAALGGHVVDVVVHPLVDFVGVVAQGLGQGFDGGGKSGPPAAAPAGACANATAPEPNRRGQMSRCRIYSQISLYRMWGKRRQLSIYELLA